MSQFFIVLPAHGREELGRSLFHKGIAARARLGFRTSGQRTETAFGLVATFPRLNGTAGCLTTDASTGNWIVACGTWFHEAGFAVGEEHRLLERLWEVGPEKVATEIEGFFCIAAGDAVNRQVTVITDLIGSCHCFHRSLSGVVAISGSSLLLAALDDATIDPVACQEFVATAAIYEDRTLFREVRRLPAASCVTYREGRQIGSRAYWQIRDLPLESLTGQTALDALRDRLVAATRRIHRVFPRISCDLTGGYDSRVAVAAFMTAGVPITTTVSGPVNSADVLIAGALSARTGFPHRYIEPLAVEIPGRLGQILPLTDGEFDAFEYARIFAIHCRLARDFDISVNGYAGEHGRGYGWEVLFPHAGRRMRLNAQKLAIRRFVPVSYDSSIFRKDIRLDFAAHFADVVARTGRNLTDLPNTAQYDHCMLMLRAARWQGRIATATDQLWPTLSIFLLRSVMDVLLSTQTRLRRRSLFFRRLLTAMQPSLAQYPLDNGYPPLPLSWRNIYRFWPMIPLYAGKVRARVARFLPLSKGGAPLDEVQIARQRLWRDDDLGEVLNARLLLTESVMDPAELDRFLQNSKGNDFAFERQWARLLTVEMALRRLRIAQEIRADVSCNA